MFFANVGVPLNCEQASSHYPQTLSLNPADQRRKRILKRHLFFTLERNQFQQSNLCTSNPGWG